MAKQLFFSLLRCKIKFLIILRINETNLARKISVRISAKSSTCHVHHTPVLDDLVLSVKISQFDNVALSYFQTIAIIQSVARVNSKSRTILLIIEAATITRYYKIIALIKIIISHYK